MKMMVVVGVGMRKVRRKARCDDGVDGVSVDKDDDCRGASDEN